MELGIRLEVAIVAADFMMDGTLMLVRWISRRNNRWDRIVPPIFDTC